MNAHVYCHIPSGTAWAQKDRLPPNLSGFAYCFEIPLDWVPQSQNGFEMMMKAKGYACGPRYKWQGLYEET